MAFGPEGDVAYFTRREGRWGTTEGRSTIHVTRRTDLGWTPPEPAPFSGTHHDSDPFVTPDGRELFFVSDRPPPSGPPGGQEIWVVRLDGDESAEPEHVGAVSSPADEYSPVLTASGDLYFASARPGGSGQGDLYVSRRGGNGFGPVRSLGPGVNSPFGEWNLVVSPREDVLILEASGRALNQSTPGDLYLSVRREGVWASAVPLTTLNTTGSDLLPRFSPDGARLLYATSRSLDGVETDVLSVDFAEVRSRASSTASPVLLAVSRSAHHVAVIDPSTLRVVDRLPTQPGPHEVAVSGSRAVTADLGVFPTPHADPVRAHPGFSEHPTGNTLTVLDLATSSTRTIELPSCARTHGIQMDGSGTLAWATCEDEAAIAEVDLTQARVVRRWNTEQVGSHRVVVTDDERFLVAANVEAGTVSVIDRETESTAVVQTGAGSEGMDVAADGTVWVAAAGDDVLVQVDPASATIRQTIPSGGRFPIAVTIDRTTGHAWVAHMGTRSVDILDLATGTSVGRVALDAAPLRTLVPEGSRHAYVSLPRENAIEVVDRARQTVIGRIPDVMEVDGLAWGSLPPP